jgi:hypothetical protein
MQTGGKLREQSRQGPDLAANIPAKNSAFLRALTAGLAFLRVRTSAGERRRVGIPDITPKGPEMPGIFRLSLRKRFISHDTTM